MTVLRAAALLCVLAFPAAAQDGGPTSSRAEETDPAVIEVRDKLTSDPAVAQVVAKRVADSQLIGLITTDGGEDARVAAAKEWIAKDPDSAARVAIGLLTDDRMGKHDYEDNLLRQMRKGWEHNPGAEKNLYGRLRKNAKQSKLLKKQSEELSADEQRELLRNLFEGLGAQSDKVISGKDQTDGKIPEASKPAATSFNGLYDRLSAGNICGYSPQLLALQNSLNARRPPGAPPLIETGKIDFATLSYPAYGMKYDINNLEARLRRNRLLALARLSGRTLTARDWKDPDLEEKLSRNIPSSRLSPRLKKSAELAAKARAALEAFAAAAAKAKDPNAVSRKLLVELGAKQKETARWITAAAIEEELTRLEPLEGFLTPELLAAIDAVPSPVPAREAYKKRGTALQDRIAQVKAGGEQALALLESGAWAASLGKVDELMNDARALKANLGRDADDFSRVPFQIAEARTIQPRWREYLDDLAVNWAPSLDYSKTVARRRGRMKRLLAVFAMIASGDANGAHTALVNENGGR